MSKIVTMDDYSRNAVESFIQTVVFVDDNIYAPPPEGNVLEAGAVSSPRERKLSGRKASAAIAQERKQKKIQIEPPTFSPHDIQASFAKKGIVCSLHQPKKGLSVGGGSDAYKLCASADIVIIDWDLYGDAGEKATILIQTLISNSLKEDPNQLRLALIYSDAPNLFDIANQIYEKLSEVLGESVEAPEADKGLAFHTLNARVMVLGKTTKRLPEYADYEVPEKDLADRAIREFCNLAGGLLQGGVLMGLAAIRKQSRKILRKFPSNLDAAFLTHRALGLPDEEAFDHIIPLLVAEIEAVLEDSLPHPLIGDTIVENWCDNHWDPETHAKANATEAKVDIRDLAKTFCANGLNSDKYSLSKKKCESLLPEYLSKSTNHELSVLMSQRTHYDNSRYLAQGAIIREQVGEKRYLLCLQPTCDSVRLKSQTTFIFCSMTVATKNTVTHVVSDGTGFEDLVYKPKIKNCVALSFRPSKERITATKLKFTDVNKNAYQWIAQLKPQHSQRAVEQFARELSRVGLTESEWLRLKSK